MIREIDAGLTEPLYDELRDNGGAFDGSSFTVALELLQIGGTEWAPATDYLAGALTRPTTANGRVYECIVAGQSDASNEPIWPLAFAGTVVDGTAEWQDITPSVAWYVQAVGQVVISDYDRLPPDTSYRRRYLVTDNFGKIGPFPNLGKYDVWRVSAVMAG